MKIIQTLLVHFSGYFHLAEAGTTGSIYFSHIGMEMDYHTVPYSQLIRIKKGIYGLPRTTV